MGARPPPSGSDWAGSRHPSPGGRPMAAGRSGCSPSPPGRALLRGLRRAAARAATATTARAAVRAGVRATATARATTRANASATAGPSASTTARAKARATAVIRKSARCMRSRSMVRMLLRRGRGRKALAVRAVASLGGRPEGDGAPLPHRPWKHAGGAPCAALTGRQWRASIRRCAPPGDGDETHHPRYLRRAVRTACRSVPRDVVFV